MGLLAVSTYSKVAALGASEQLIATAKGEEPMPVNVWIVTRNGQDALVVFGDSHLTLADTAEVMRWPWSNPPVLEALSLLEVKLSYADQPDLLLRFHSGAALRDFSAALAERGVGVSTGRLNGAPLEEPKESGKNSQSGPRGRRERSYRMIDQLSLQRKYRLAMSGERYAFLSLWGTEDWEDYASLAISAMTLEAILDVDQRLESMADSLSLVADRINVLIDRLQASEPIDPNASTDKGSEF
jgi:hypothetical protein